MYIRGSVVIEFVYRFVLGISVLDFRDGGLRRVRESHDEGENEENRVDAPRQRDEINKGVKRQTEENNG